jgi:hypothetical protein
MTKRIEELQVSPDGRTLSFSSPDSFLITEIDGSRLIYHELAAVPKGFMGGGFDACLFSADGRNAWTACHTTGRETELQRRDTRGWGITTALHLTTPALGCHLHFVPHPEGRAFAVWAAAGQDGQWLYWVYDDGVRAHLSPALPLSTCISPPAFHSAGGEFLLIEDCCRLRRYSFPDCQLLGTLAEDVAAEVEHEDDPLESFCYFTDGRALLSFAESGRISIVDLDTMTILEEITLEPRAARKPFHHEVPVGPEHILSVYMAEEANADNWKDVLVLWGGRPPFGTLTVPDPACPHTARLLESQGWN